MSGVWGGGRADDGCGCAIVPVHPFVSISFNIFIERIRRANGEKRAYRVGVSVGAKKESRRIDAVVWIDNYRCL